MRLLPRMLFLTTAAAVLILWPFGLSGTAAWVVRVLTVVAAASVAARWAVAPWKDFERAAARVRVGDFMARLDDVSPGDLASPSAAFNEMVDELASARRLSEEREGRLLAVLSATDRGVVVLDRNEEVVLASPATRALFPRFTESEGLGGLFLGGLPDLVRRAREEGHPARAELTEREGSAGRIFDVQTAALPGGDAVIYLRDITEESRLDRIKADLVANVSHELRTPLAALSSLAEALCDQDLPPDKRSRFTAKLSRQIEGMGALLEDLLSLAKLEDRTTRPSMEEIPLLELCRRVAESLLPAAESREVAVELRVPPDLSLRSDPRFLAMALGNLLDNAVRYNRRGGKVLLLCERKNGAVCLRVKDTGEGIPARHLGRIFERFFRVDPHRSREKGGTGLGLAIVKHAAEVLGGSVEVESTVGQGSVFTLTLPDSDAGKSAAAPGSS